MNIEREWAQPNHRTFEIPPIKRLIDEELGEVFVDPFPFPYKQDALDYLKTFKPESVRGLAFDPPYSQRQLVEMYKSAGLHLQDRLNNSWWAKLRDIIAKIMKIGGEGDIIRLELNWHG